MRALITGGAGFVGSHLAEALLTRGDEVWVLDTLSTGRLENLAACLLLHPRFEFVTDTVLNRELLRVLVASCDIVYHLAAVLDPDAVARDPLSAAAVNIRGTENVLAAAAEHGRKVVLVSSSEVYGKNTAMPLREEYDRVLGPTNAPRWSYASAKAITEHFAFAYTAGGLPVAIVRLFNSYGPRLHTHGYATVIARFIRQSLAGRPLTVYGDGCQTRCFIYIDDAVAGVLLAGDSPEANGRVFNIGDPNEISIANLAYVIRSLTGSSSEVRLIPYADAYGQHYEDTRRRVPDLARARLSLGFRPRMSLESGLLRTIGWCRERRIIETSDPASLRNGSAFVS
jgi:UDP-glucose 4-epimerase